MNLFQWLTIPVLAALLLWELVVRRRRAVSFGFWLLRCLAWVTAALAISYPDLVNRMALAIGIGRGADVVLYLFVMAFLATAFYFYSRAVVLQRQLTQLTRHIAIREARHGTGRDAAIHSPLPPPASHTPISG